MLSISMEVSWSPVADIFFKKEIQCWEELYDPILINGEG